ncbi:MAG: hypothetical protein ACIAXF_04905 [Phycisphaerales bacterium JB063]
MNIPTYWAHAAVDAQGDPTDLQSGYLGVGWSSTSEEDAHRCALERARRIAQRIEHGDFDHPDLHEQYYTNRPLREQVVDQLDAPGEPLAVITQNIYGAYVLNASRAMFIDIDVPAPPRPRPRRPEPRGFFARLFGQPAPPPAPPTTTAEPDPIDRIRSQVERQPGMGMKVYRTPAGFRGLVTSQPYDPDADAAHAVMKSFAADKLYTILCKAQHCFRARLTPKPWRIGMDNPPRAFPFLDDNQRRAFDAWKQQYDQRITGYAACAPLSNEPWGNPDVHPDIAPVLAWHDQLACGLGLPLA